MLCSLNKSKKGNTASFSLQGVHCQSTNQTLGHSLHVLDTEDDIKKEQKPWNNTKQSFPWTENKEDLFYIIFVQFMKFWPTFGITFVELMKKQE